MTLEELRQSIGEPRCLRCQLQNRRCPESSCAFKPTWQEWADAQGVGRMHKDMVDLRLKIRDIAQRHGLELSKEKADE